MDAQTEKIKRVLITGVSGLIGRIVFFHLFNKFTEKYFVLGLDRNRSISTRYFTENGEDFDVKQVQSVPEDRFIECDINDRSRLHQIIEQNEIDIVIHLAALLESESNVERIFEVNLQGTRNVIEAPRLERIINASSVMVFFGYLQDEPYSLLTKANQTIRADVDLTQIRQLKAESDETRPDLRTEQVRAYSLSKIMAEEMADKCRDKSIINVRFGWVNTKDQAGEEFLSTVWLSQRDCSRFIELALQAPLTVRGNYFLLSRNFCSWIDSSRTERDFQFEAADGSRPFDKINPTDRKIEREENKDRL